MAVTDERKIDTDRYYDGGLPRPSVGFRTTVYYTVRFPSLNPANADYLARSGHRTPFASHARRFPTEALALAASGPIGGTVTQHEARF